MVNDIAAIGPLAVNQRCLGVQSPLKG